MSAKQTKPAPILADDIIAALDALPHGRSRPWTAAEDAALRHVGNRTSAAELSRAWPGLFGWPRTATCIQSHRRNIVQ